MSHFEGICKCYLMTNDIFCCIHSLTLCITLNSLKGGWHTNEKFSNFTWVYKYQICHTRMKINLSWRNLSLNWFSSNFTRVQWSVNRISSLVLWKKEEKKLKLVWQKKCSKISEKENHKDNIIITYVITSS